MKTKRPNIEDYTFNKKTDRWYKDNGEDYDNDLQNYIDLLEEKLRSNGEQLVIQRVIQRCELLVFEDWVNKNTTTALKDGIKLAIENYKKANCG